MRFALMLPLIIFAGVAGAGLAGGQSVVAPAAPTAPLPDPPGGIIPGPLYQKHLAAGLHCIACHAETPPATAANASTCLTCHGPVAALVEKTATARPNPHSQAHIGPIPCTACHHIHFASASFCNTCHSFDMMVP